jgi:hypothetical protein
VTGNLSIVGGMQLISTVAAASADDNGALWGILITIFGGSFWVVWGMRRRRRRYDPRVNSGGSSGCGAVTEQAGDRADDLG